MVIDDEADPVAISSAGQEIQATNSVVAEHEDEMEEVPEDRNWNEEFQAILDMAVTTPQEKLAREAAAYRYKYVYLSIYAYVNQWFISVRY